MSMVNPKPNTSSPLIGVLVRKSHILKFKNLDPDMIFEELDKVNRRTKKRALYFFSIQDVALKKQKVIGTYYNENKKTWETKKFPYPDIVYRRGYVGKPKRRDLFEFEKQLHTLNIPTLNYMYGFNKWQAHQKLKQYNELLPHLPYTILYRNPDDLKTMFKTSDKLYLKGCNGGKGKQVMRVSKLLDGSYEYSHFNDQLYVFKTKSIHNLILEVEAFFAGRDFIVQEAIDLITVNNSIVDMRAEVQRDGNGELTVTAIPVRLSNDNAPITAHASGYTFEYFFREFMNYSEDEIIALKNRVTDFLKLTYQCIEKSFGPSGEIGIDMGMDKSGQLWFIECNSRSMKVSLFKAYDEETIKQSYLNLLEYAEYLHKSKTR